MTTSERNATLLLAIVHTALGAALFCGGCKDKLPADPPATPAVTKPEAMPPVSEPTAIPAITQREGEELLARWLELQNRGAYDAYAQLYASKFYGVKRAGTRVKRFARDAWLADRKRMFAKSITVAALTPAIVTATNTAEIEFIQRFATGNFRDEGPKRLLVVREGAALKIVHEEMLASRELLAAPPATPQASDFHFVLPVESGLYLLLAASSGAEAYGPAKREPDASVMVWNTTRAVRETHVPKPLLAWKGQRVRIDGGCIAQVGEFVVLSRVDPHFGTLQDWEGSSDNGPSKPLSPQQTANAAFALGSKFLSAKLTGCTTGVYAQRETAALPLFSETVEDAELSARALAAFAKRPEVREEQESYLAEVEGAQGTWWDGRVKVDIFRHPRSGQTLVSVRGELPGDGCSDWSAQQWVLFEPRGKALIPLRIGADAPNLFQVLDLDGDGRLELITADESLGVQYSLRSPERQEPDLTLSYDFQDCPC